MRAIPRTTRVPNRLGPAGRPRRSRPAAQRFDVRPHAEETSAEVPTNPPSASRSSSLSSHPAAQRFDVRTNRARKASPEILERLSQNLTRLRRARGLTQRALAQRCGVTKAYVSNIEQGTINVTLATLETLAQGLFCCVTDLLRQPPPRPTLATASPPAPNHEDTREQS